jgi:hypothetical protein
MVPGAILLGAAEACYECGHAHGEGDRCLSFQDEPDMLEVACAEAGARPAFARKSLPPKAALAPLFRRLADL